MPDCPGPVRVVRQPNAGAYAARNTGLDHASGDAVAFFDSDDLWLPHHLERCAEALVRHPGGGLGVRRVPHGGHGLGPELEPSTFYVNGRPRPFLSLAHTRDGELRVIDDQRATAMQIRARAVLRAAELGHSPSVFERRRFWPDYLVVEDEMFVIRLLAEGGRFAYFDDLHVVYRVHADNSSGSAVGSGQHAKLRIFSEMVRGLERVGRETPLSVDARRALHAALAQERFWGLGYSGYWQGGRGRSGPGLLSAGAARMALEPGDVEDVCGVARASVPRRPPSSGIA